MGGLDEYILKTPDKKLKSTKAQELRARLLARAEEMYERERALAQDEAAGPIDAAVVEEQAGPAQDGSSGLATRAPPSS